MVKGGGGVGTLLFVLVFEPTDGLGEHVSLEGGAESGLPGLVSLALPQRACMARPARGARQTPLISESVFAPGPSCAPAPLLSLAHAPALVVTGLLVPCPWTPGHSDLSFLTRPCAGAWLMFVKWN